MSHSNKTTQIAALMIAVTLSLPMGGCGGGGGGDESSGSTTPVNGSNPPSSQVPAYFDYEGTWHEACTADAHLRVGNATGSPAYRKRVRTVQSTAPLLHKFSYSDQISIYDNNTCTGSPKVSLTQPGEIRAEAQISIQGKPAERVTLTVYVSQAAGGGVPINNINPYLLNGIYFPQAGITADLGYFGQAVFLKSVQQIDGGKWYFMAPHAAGDLYPENVSTTTWLEK